LKLLCLSFNLKIVLLFLSDGSLSQIKQYFSVVAKRLGQNVGI
jgi:hypothetical protein